MYTETKNMDAMASQMRYINATPYIAQTNTFS